MEVVVDVMGGGGYVCVCVQACVRARVCVRVERGGVCMCVCVLSLIHI